MKSSLEIPTHWTFRNRKVARHFNQHVREQLPWYDLATTAVANFGRHYVPRGGLVYDVGASTGNIGSALSETLYQRGAHFVAIEASREMAEQYQGPPDLVIADAVTFDYEPFDFAVCFLVLMFLPVVIRVPFLERLRGLIRPGGALVVVDKLQQPAGYLGTAFNRLTLAQKLIAGARPDDILRKELSLAGYQRPIEEATISGPGTHKFFQMGEFAGWIITKEETHGTSAK